MKRPLTINQAQAEARWRWGSLFKRGFAHIEISGRQPFQVGTKLFGRIVIRGRGTSWEGAFGNADRETNIEKPAK